MGINIVLGYSLGVLAMTLATQPAINRIDNFNERREQRQRNKAALREAALRTRMQNQTNDSNAAPFSGAKHRRR